MDKGEKDILDALTPHQRREQRKKERGDVQKQKEELIERKQSQKNYLWIGISITILVVFAVGVMWMLKNKPETYTDREVHWHATFELEICGERMDLPCKKVGSGQVHGKSFCGMVLMHHHDDNTMHIEGLIQNKEDIFLGNFFDEIGVPFAKDRILEYRNGDECPDGRPGVLKMYVNDQPRDDFREFVPFATGDARKQVIRLVFGPEEEAEANQTEA